MYSMAVRTCPVNPRQHKFAVIADSAIFEVNINSSHYGADGDHPLTYKMKLLYW